MSVIETAASLRELAEQSNAWPFEEARKDRRAPEEEPKPEVIFENRLRPLGPAAYRHPSARWPAPPWLRHAFRVLTDDKIQDPADRLLRRHGRACARCRTTCRTRRLLAQHLGKPLTKVPDPVGNPPSFGLSTTMRGCAPSRHVRLRVRILLLDRVLQVRALRRHAAQASGELRRGDEHHAAVAARGAGRRPIHRSCRSICAPASSSRFRCWRMTPSAAPSPTKSRRPRSASPCRSPAGRCKLQWKPDWAMRWVALVKHYEMAGKDH